MAHCTLCACATTLRDFVLLELYEFAACLLACFALLESLTEASRRHADVERRSDATQCYCHKMGNDKNKTSESFYCSSKGIYIYVYVCTSVLLLFPYVFLFLCYYCNCYGFFGRIANI